MISTCGAGPGSDGAHCYGTRIEVCAGSATATARPSGYRDGVALGGGRLFHLSVRQRHRDGNVHENALVEIGRAFAHSHSGTVHPDRARAPLIPAASIQEDWLRSA